MKGNRISRRDFLWRAMLLGGGAALWPLVQACEEEAAPTPTTPRAGTTPAPARPSRTFNFAYLTLGWAGTEIIHRQNLLGRRGWNMQWQTVGPVSGLVNTFASGQADIIDMSVIIAGQMYEQGVKLKVFGTAVGSLGGIVVPQDSPIRSAADLRGRKVGGIPGSTTFQDINGSLRKSFNLDLSRDTQLVTAADPPAAVNLLMTRQVDALVIWEPVVAQLELQGPFRILATQQQLWEQASGSRLTQVHVVYLTTTEIAQQYPELLRDINDAQREAAEMWNRRDDAAITSIMEITQLPRDVVVRAMSRTTILYGLSDDQMNLIIEQLKFNREHGTILRSDVWNDAARVKNEFFLKV